MFAVEHHFRLATYVKQIHFINSYIRSCRIMFFDILSMNLRDRQIKFIYLQKQQN